MKLTLLEMVQQILLSMDGDEVNDIDETPESAAVARIVREAFYDIAGTLDLPEHHDIFKLEATGASTPTTMTLPSDVMSVEWIKYNNIADDATDPVYLEVDFMPFKRFVEYVNSWDIDDDDNVQTYTLTGSNSADTTTLKCRQDAMPRWWTTPDDYQILFDGFDEDEDANLQASKTMCYGLIAPTFTLSNSFTPDLDHAGFNMLLNEAKAQCFADLKQSVNPRAERKARRNWIETQKKKRNLGYPNERSYNSNHQTYPNYGRK
jgi:hypothetical protein